MVETYRGRRIRENRPGDHYDPAMTEFRVLFTAADYDDTVAFFTDTMELPILRSWDDHGRGTIISAAGEGQIEIFAGDSSTATMNGAALAWEVYDIDERCSRLRAAGVEFPSPPADQPWGHRNATMTGPEGLTITLFTVISETA
jgi:catechol 2,3-dioxygenase-like lactoylglutathione lyase family enzyme